MKLLNVIIFFFLLFPNFSFSIENTHFLKAKLEFEQLKEQWDKEFLEYAYSSNTYDYWKGEAAKAILNMGKRALPFIFDEIEKGNFFFIVAAEWITKVNIDYKEHQAWQDRAIIWVKWWHKNKTKHEWNLFLPVK